MTNSYDEYGEVVLETGWKAYVPTPSSMTKFQKWAMAASVLSIVFLGVYSCYLHREIGKRKFTWAPRRYDAYGDPSKMGRMQSGILAGRSRSGNNFELRGGHFT